MKELQDLWPKDFNNDMVMIDVRREEEWLHTGVIDGAIKLTFFDMFGQCDIPSWLQEFQKHVTSKEQSFLLICAHANRTRTIGNYLIKELGYENVYHLAGGMAQWVEEGRETI